MKLRLIYTIVVLTLHLGCYAVETASDLARKGREYIETSNFSMAMRYFTKSMEAAEREGDIHTLMVSTGYISNVYFNIYDYTRCIQYLLKGYDMAVKQNDTELQGSFLTNIVAAYCKTGNVDKAWEYFHKLEKMPFSEQTAHFIYYKMYNRARIATAEGKISEAISYHERTLQWVQAHGLNAEYALYQYCEIGQLYLKQGLYDKTVEYGNKCILPAQQRKELDLLTSVYKMLADAYSLKGDAEHETEFRRLYLALSDSIFNRSRIFSADKDLVEYEERQNNEQIDSLNGVISMQTMAIVAISVALIGLVFLSFMLFRYNRKLKMAHRTLIDKNEQLTKAEYDREKMLEQLLDKTENVDEMGKNSVGLDKEQMGTLLKRIMKVMGDNDIISKPDFSLNILADMVGSNTKYVSWVINDTYGKNFKTLLNEHRIREACKRLSDSEHYGNMTIQAIYEEVGYTNAVSFIRAFKKVNGMTPSEYQKISEQEREKPNSEE